MQSANSPKTIHKKLSPENKYMDATKKTTFPHTSDDAASRIRETGRRRSADWGQLAPFLGARGQRGAAGPNRGLENTKTCHLCELSPSCQRGAEPSGARGAGTQPGRGARLARPGGGVEARERGRSLMLVAPRRRPAPKACGPKRVCRRPSPFAVNIHLPRRSCARRSAMSWAF